MDTPTGTYTAEPITTALTDLPSDDAWASYDVPPRSIADEKIAMVMQAEQAQTLEAFATLLYGIVAFGALLISFILWQMP